MALQGSGANLQGSSVNLNTAHLAGGIYWVGSNGHIYYKGPGGNGAAVTDMGGNSGGTRGKLALMGANQISDPNAPQQATNNTAASTAPSSPNGSTGGGTSAPLYEDKSNDIALQMAGLGSLDSQLNSGLGTIDSALGKLKGQYATEATSNEGNYNDQSVTNRTNLQKNDQTAYVNAAQGRQGLFGTLASLGALNGDGIYLANHAVQNGANADLSGASDNFSTNQNGLDLAIKGFRDENKRRNDNADTAAENARQNTRNDVAKSRMSFLTNLANDYQAEGKTSEAKTYSDQAGALYPTLAATSIPNSNIAYSAAAFTPGTLADYMAGANSTAVTATPANGNNGVPGLVAAPTKKKQTASV